MSHGDYRRKLSPPEQKGRRLMAGRLPTNARVFPLIRHLLHCPTTSRMKLFCLLVPLVHTSSLENPSPVRVNETVIKHFINFLLIHTFYSRNMPSILNENLTFFLFCD